MISRKPPPTMKNRQLQPHVVRSPNQHSPERFGDPEVGRMTLKARSKLYELIVQFRSDAAVISDAKAQTLFEFSAEILAGLARSFREFDESRSET